MTTLHECAYAAGFFDGEGCVRIIRPTHNQRWALRVQFSQTNPGPLHWLSARWGGAVCGPYQPKGQRRPVWRWTLYGQRATKFLEDTHPWLKCKQGEVWLALEYRAQCPPRPLNQRSPLTEEENALREGFRLALLQSREFLTGLMELD